MSVCSSDWFDILDSVSIVIGVMVSIWGINSWRREMLGHKKSAIAEEMLIYFYEFRDLMKWVRSPFSYVGEAKSRVRGELESDDETKRKDTFFVPIERISSQKEFFAKVRVLRYRGMAYFGNDIDELFTELNKVKVAVEVSAEMLMGADSDYEKDDIKKWKADIGWGLIDGDSLASNIDNAIEKMEKICKPYLMDKKSP